jgi:hypothetical protein
MRNMNKKFGPGFTAVALLVVQPLLADPARDDTQRGVRPERQEFADGSGLLGTLNLNGRTDHGNPFFQSLGTNGRSCASCHVADQAFTISPPDIRTRFQRSRGQDPLFAPVDGANCANARRSSAADHSLLLNNGLIHVALQLPSQMQFTISVVHDPYGCAITADPKGGAPFVSVYRRPLPAANLMFLSTVMFDGRETLAPLNSEATFDANLIADLTHQALDATMGHAQAAQAPSAQQLAEIVNFELGMLTAQARDDYAGRLDRRGAQGGTTVLANAPYYPGINDVLGADPHGVPFDEHSMSLFASWADGGPDHDRRDDARAEAARRAIAAGEEIFNSAPLVIAAVRGLNDNPALGAPASFVGHCSSCHDTPNVGNHSLPLPLDIGTAHTGQPAMESDPSIAAALAQLSMPDLPVYLISGCPNTFAPGQPESFYTTDPGKALLTGNCSDFNRIKGPILRGIAARAPYFHNGAAANLHELVDFYNERFAMHLSAEQKAELVAFLNSL